MLGGVLSTNERVVVTVGPELTYNSGTYMDSANEMDSKVVESSPRSRSKAKAILWLKDALQGLGSAVFEGEVADQDIDQCNLTPLPPLQKLCAALVRESRSSFSILNTMSFNKILRNICAVRSEYVMKICKPVLQKLMAHDRNRNVFNHPVDPVELGIPNYPLVIKRPMDLGTVMSNLRGGAYYTAKACFADMALVFENAMLFNPLPHDVHKMAKDLLADLHNEVAQAEGKCVKESEKKSNHSCNLCCGSTCQLCGEKCLKFEPPSLNCQQCGTRIKKNAFFFVCSDGSALWCQKCYVALPPVITPAAPRMLHSADSSNDLTSDSAAELTTSSSAANLEAEADADADMADATLEMELAAASEPACAISTSDADSQHGAFCPTPGGSTAGGGAPLLKKQLLKRRADEEVAEPWVACDSCGNWYHQICAMYTTLSDAGASKANKSFCCPYCVVLVGCQQIGVDLESCLSSIGTTSHSPAHPRSQITNHPQHTANTSITKTINNIAINTITTTTATNTISTEMDVVEEETHSYSEDAEMQRLKVQLAAKFHSASLFQHILEYSPLSSPVLQDKKKIVKGDKEKENEGKDEVRVEMVEGEDGEEFTVLIHATPSSHAHTHAHSTSAVVHGPGHGSSSCVSTGSLSEGEMLVRGGGGESDFDAQSINSLASVTSEASGCGVQQVSDPLQYQRDLEDEGEGEGDEDVEEMQVDVSAAESAEAVVGSTTDSALTSGSCDGDATPHKTPLPAYLPSPLDLAPSPVAWKHSADASPAAHVAPHKALDPHWKWRAASLPHTQLGDFLQQLVQDLLVTNGHHDAAGRITIRMTSNHDRALEVPASIVDNLIAPSGHCIPTCMGYKQKCVLLFQEIDGVDVCLFSLYVHEFDAHCPSPNTSTVYIAYLDSVDYFRPISARTMVYQEIVAGYLKWSQARGFKAAHIWSCPPHRGDNFIFNSHPAHQKYPSRERLNHWYKSILQRCAKTGVIAETGNLWAQYFSKYVRRDVVPVARQAAKNSFVGSGKAVKKTNAKAKKKGAPVGVSNDVPSGVVGGVEGVIGAVEGGEVAPLSAPLTAVASTSATTAASTNSDLASDAPVCPPIFDGDYWVQQYVYLVRLHTQRSKAQSSAAQRLHQSVRKFRELLKRLMLREESTPFLHPVDHIALDIPNYTLVVKQPMDFSTIKEKLGAGEYQTALHFVNDVRLVFMNAKLFNPPEHAVYLNAESLSARFEKGLKLALSELQELNGNGLLRMPIPEAAIAAPVGEGVRSSASNAHHAGSNGSGCMETLLEKIVLSQKLIAAGEGGVEIVTAVENGTMQCRYASNTIVPRFGTADLAFDCSSYTSSSNSSSAASATSSTTETTTPGFTVAVPCTAHSPGPAVVVPTVTSFRTPLCTTVSRSGSLVDEQDFATSSGGRRSRSQSISITPVLSHPALSSSPHRTPIKKESAHFLSAVHELSDTELDGDTSGRQLQHVVSQDFGSARTRDATSRELSDDATKRKKLDWDCAYSGGSPDSEAKRRRVSEHSRCNSQTDVMEISQDTTQAGALPTQTSAAVKDEEEQRDAALLASALRTVEFRADTLNKSHRPVPFSSPALGSQNTMTIVAELSKRMQRQYDDLFVIKLASPDVSAADHPTRLTTPTAAQANGLTAGATSTAPMAVKKPRGRVAMNVKRVPAMHLHGGLKELSDECRAMLRQVTPDTSDPDPIVRSPATDSRHTFLELCQFRHYQFDSLRRAKYSSLMLLFHLQHPHSKSCRPCCAHCEDVIHTLRWHCDECPSFDLCGTCYAADQTKGLCPHDCNAAPAAPVVPQTSPRRRSLSLSRSSSLTQASQAEVAPKSHMHALTPYRVSIS